MDEKIRVYNKTKHNVGVYLLDLPNVGHNIGPGMFLYMTSADIEMLTASTTLFSDGTLCPEEKGKGILADAGIDVENSPAFADAEAIRKALSQSGKKIEEWLSGIDQGRVLDAIYDVAMEMNLPASKLKVLQAKMPDREFI